MSSIEERTKAWIAGDPDPGTRAELSGLIQDGAWPELEERMAGTLEFGTAGIRGVVEGGSNRMNRAVVIRTTAGLAEYLKVTTPPEQRLVVVGRDARPSSQVFMEDTIGVLSAAGFTVRYFEDTAPTPIVAFAGLQFGACASIVITASHNPPRDNGYKVYASNGAQIVSPMDSDIASHIDAIGPANAVPRSASPLTVPDVSAIGPELFDDYLHAVASTLPAQTGDRSISIVYSAMHGVGGAAVVAALSRFGFSSIHPVARQFEPDGTFPTVSFPNPEEPGALDLAHELASAIDADLVVANDPDADRLAVSVPFPGGLWTPLTGNQIGCLLAEFLLTNRSGSDGPVINSIVSTPLLGKIARQHNVTWAQTLTGFKWVCNAAFDLEDAGEDPMILGFEEALGYSVGTTVRDKDGISAIVAFAILAAIAQADGATVLERLDSLYQRYGVWTSAQVSIRREGSTGVSDIADAMQALRESPLKEIDGVPVVGVTDYSVGAEARPRYLGATNLIELDLGETGRVLARPSGTEPKLKVYVDLAGSYPESGDWIGTENALNATAIRMGESLAEWLTDQMG
ncbi:MAG: phospho-sugar mutase [Acidimicrobiia bacterium]